jgi:hypothetical protein
MVRIARPTLRLGASGSAIPPCVKTAAWDRLARRWISRYDTRHVDIYESARKHGVSDDDIVRAIDFALLAAEQDDGKVLYLGPDKSGNLLEVVTVRRDDATEIVIHAMKMRRMYEPMLREMGGTDD